MMPVESWLKPEDVPELAARATAMIDAALTGSGLTRETYWSAVRKGYNTPYNDPPRKRPLPAQANAVASAVTAPDPVAVPAAVIAALAAEVRAV
ncbi:hypothetical protein [Methylobacterium pseudosasicola]|uniref:Uncharacterized protein n=1 Tax=Methylobacterium pseudosasicola TaxID=582667 RepID=A0A1I4HAS2_9HYPH|nr:hypothetical protein [Methylobacterium pseudosasicola]SFL38531.1 hypothetical protein SAMN05192568_100490 [Methylobacterium pseudosasicola]